MPGSRGCELYGYSGQPIEVNAVFLASDYTKIGPAFLCNAVVIPYMEKPEILERILSTYPAYLMLPEVFPQRNEFDRNWARGQGFELQEWGKIRSGYLTVGDAGVYRLTRAGQR